MSNIQKFGLNIEIVKDLAENVHGKFADNSIDVLRIDGNHDTAYVFKDLNLYINKVKTNGIVLMDDTDWSSVNTAMTMFLKEHPSVHLEHTGAGFCVLGKLISGVVRENDKLAKFRTWSNSS